MRRSYYWGWLKNNISAKARNLNCVVVDTLNGYVLCHRTNDDTYITWLVQPHHGELPAFENGHYDLNGLTDARADLIERAYGIAPPLDRPVYIVWNSGKAGGATTYRELLRHEETENGSVSSQVQTSDIKSFLEACYNETDIDLCCHTVTPTNTVTITLTVASHYDTQAVINELNHGITCFDSELFDTLTSIKAVK